MTRKEMLEEIGTVDGKALDIRRNLHPCDIFKMPEVCGHFNYCLDCMQWFWDGNAELFSVHKEVKI